MATSNKERRERQRREFWQKHVDAWQHSRMSISAYCAEHGLIESSFRAGQRDLESCDEIPQSTQKSDAVRWVPVHIVATPTASPLELVLPDGLVIRVPSGFDPQTLRRLLSALEGDREVSSC
jgi:hypothetical protein